ncbi:MAG TPA: response regulator transcription factor [Anaerolineae bacterium]|jgi:DNA-binding NarL/FixJ family response regulator|nr:response regulator transcription factor [Anaerolineae bacterium]
MTSDPKEAENGTRRRVLIVDDNAQVRQELRVLLPLAGNVEIVGEAADGAEAIELVRAVRPDAVLLDLEMPVLNGYAAVRSIKVWCPACRVIALTVHGYEAARQKAMQAGVDLFLVKGVPVETVVQAIFERSE